ncbi:uncharacterized protein LOC125739317 [Brienomyrus brachyistius]|uniref:uncharacterized protein LOC125739317 n=1 Tax=Brienomyrus brachyistius TaxID=42636 RepID=UPI0020B2D7FB|nr:uncharacterized protein LOC125739317 [Brienomyrus brachyistius]
MADIVKATQSISKAGDFRDDTKLIMQPYANWEEYLVPAPVSIAILGELVCISSNVDFSINKNPPKGGFQLIKYPDSFRACLMQVANSGWAAFNEAHKNMDQIRLHTGSVPAYIRTSVQILLQDNDELVQTLLPDQLENISTISDQCVQLADQAEKKFTIVINLIQELLEACISAKKVYGDDLENVKRKIEETNMRKEDSEKAKERAQKTLEDMNKCLDESQKTFDKAIDSLPSGWDVIGMNFVEGLTDGVLGIMSHATKIMAETPKYKKDHDDVGGMSNVLSKAGQILKLGQTLNSFIDKQQINWSEIYDQKEDKTKTAYVGEQYTQIKTSVENEKDCKAKKAALDICTDGIKLCSELSKIAPDGKCDAIQTKQMTERMQKLMKQCQTFDCENKAFTNTPAFQPEPPHQAKEGGPKRAGEMAVENARYRIEQSRAQLEKAREMQKQSLENLEKNQKELTEILVTLRNCEVNEIDFNTTIKMLVKGLDAMGRVKEQWEKMIRFFQMISNIVKTCLHRSLTDFVKQSQKASQKHLSYNTKKFMKDLIYQQAFYASNVASLVNMISGTYVEVSDKHLMDRISSLGKLMALDPSKPDFESERKKLHDACEEAQEAIRDLVKINNKKFDQKAKERMEKIERELKPMLPPASEEKMKEMKEITESAFKEMSQEDEDQFA